MNNTIMIIDDEQMILDMLRDQFETVLVKQNCNTSVQNFSEKFRIYSTVSLTMSL